MAFSNKVLRVALAVFNGVSGNEKDNDAVITKLNKATDLDWTITRPNYMMGNKESKIELITSLNKLPPFHSFILIPMLIVLCVDSVPLKRLGNRDERTPVILE